MKRMMTATLVTIVFGGTAYADECQQLWLERNGIFDKAGYCFKSRLGKGVFDNSDCRQGAVKISSKDQKRIAAIARREKSLGCAAQKADWSVEGLKAAM